MAWSPMGATQRQKRALEEAKVGLVIPEVDAAQAAGKLLEDLPRLWAKATEAERRKLLLSMLDAVYLETKIERRVVMIQPKPPFLPLFEIAPLKEGCGLRLLNEPAPAAQEGQPEPLCSWWRRGGVELLLEHRLVCSSSAGIDLCLNSNAREIQVAA